jgi:hypothetical protein
VFFSRTLARCYWTVVVILPLITVLSIAIEPSHGVAVADTALAVLWLLGWSQPRTLQKLMRHGAIFSLWALAGARFYIIGTLYLVMSVAARVSAIASQPNEPAGWQIREQRQNQIVTLGPIPWHVGVPRVETNGALRIFLAIFAFALRLFPQPNLRSGRIPLGNYTLQ